MKPRVTMIVIEDAAQEFRSLNANHAAEVLRRKA